MTYDEIDVANHISQVLEEHPLVDPTVPASLDDLDQFHIGGADAVDQLIAPTLLSTIVEAGFEVDSNETPWAKQWLVRDFADGLPTGPGLASALDNGPARLLNFAAALNDDVVAVWSGSFTKATARL